MCHGLAQAPLKGAGERLSNRVIYQRPCCSRPPRFIRIRNLHSYPPPRRSLSAVSERSGAGAGIGGVVVPKPRRAWALFWAACGPWGCWTGRWATLQFGFGCRLLGGWKWQRGRYLGAGGRGLGWAESFSINSGGFPLLESSPCNFVSAPNPFFPEPALHGFVLYDFYKSYSRPASSAATHKPPSLSPASQAALRSDLPSCCFN